uniref:site-specific DNA-methyltransferase n=1 Tax=Dysosmobacter welbionis TaxID=2093857 RepID=UPI0030795069
MNHMRFESPDMTAQNIDRIAALFPNCITEMLDEEHSTPEKKVYKRAVNFELLKQMLSPDVVDGDEAYEFTWVGKKAAIVEANKPIRKTLRPCKAESKDWDTTENLYIEGDNLEVLKLLQESYLGKVKMIYIDPPYNTGNDFIYADDFMRSQEEENAQMGMYDEDENRLFKNTDTNGRFHSDWCSMIYSRLLLARNLLTEDGFIFISVDENEFENMTKISSEVFGRSNLRNCIAVRRGIKNVQAQFDTLSSLSQGHEYILLFSKRTDSRLPKLFSVFDEKKKGKWDTFWRGTDRPTMRYELFGKCPEKGQWRWEQGRTKQAIKNYEVYLSNYSKEMSIDDYYSYVLTSSGAKTDFVRLNDEGTIQYYVPPQEGKLLSDNWMDIMMTGTYTVFDTEKSLDIMNRIVGWITKEEDIILDFFSGSATTAHAVMQLNYEDKGHRKFIMVQLPEACDAKSEAYRAGYKNICEIGKERIRRAGAEIQQDRAIEIGTHKHEWNQTCYYVEHKEECDKLGHLPDEYFEKEFPPVDTGFRVLKLDDTNMKDVYYAPDDYDQNMLAGLESNIKDDRTDLDLLFGCLIDWGLPLSLPYKSEQLGGCTVHTYNDGDLIACFDKNIPESVVKEIAQRKPLRAVFRDSGFASSPEKINVFEIFKLYMPEDAGDISKRVRVI